MASPATRVTLRAVAARAGVHYSTVSLALRNRAGVPAATRARIQRLAEEMGYHPDPMLASLARYRHEAGKYRATLAWMTNFPTHGGGQDGEIHADYFLGARERAAQMGYQLQDFQLGEGSITPARVTQILMARGITGLLLAPPPVQVDEVELEWERFAAVAIGHWLGRPKLHLVSPNHYRGIRLAMAELIRRGYTRIGLVMRRASETRLEHPWLAGYLVSQRALAVADRLAPLLLSEWDGAKFARWLDRRRPDAILSACAEALPALRRLGVRLPRDLGAAFLTQVKPAGELSGVHESAPEVGAAAVDFLAGMLQRNEQGLPEHPRHLLIEGQWIDGATVRPRAEGSAE